MTIQAMPANITLEEWAATPPSVRAWIDELSRTVQALQARLRDLEQRLHQNSQNSSQPPALDRKANRPKPARRRHRGAKRGHAKMERAWVAQPDQVIEAPLTTCSQCQADLQTVVPEHILRRQVTELPEVRPLVIETQQAEAHCPFCHSLQRGSLPAGLAAPRAFGPRLEATVVYLRQQPHLSSERTSQTLAELCGLPLSEGGQASILERAGAAAAVAAEAIRTRIQQSAVVGCDETGARVDGQLHWQWVFVATDAIYHVIFRRRSASAIQAVMGDAQVEVWVSDCWKPQFKAPAQHFQLDRKSVV